MAMKYNKLKRTVFTVSLVIVSFMLGTKSGEQTILDRWENRWFESDWYDTRSIEDFLYDKDYSIELGE
jgi:hypothetical protein